MDGRAPDSPGSVTLTPSRRRPSASPPVAVCFIVLQMAAGIALARMQGAMLGAHRFFALGINQILEGVARAGLGILLGLTWGRRWTGACHVPLNRGGNRHASAPPTNDPDVQATGDVAFSRITRTGPPPVSWSSSISFLCRARSLPRKPVRMTWQPCPRNRCTWYWPLSPDPVSFCPP